TAGQAQLDAAKAKLVDAQAQLDANTAKLVDGQAQLDAARKQLADGQATIDAGWTTIAEKQAEIDSASARLATETHKLDAGATLFDLASGVRLVSDDGSAAVAAVMFDAPQTAVTPETKDALMATFRRAPI